MQSNAFQLCYHHIHIRKCQLSFIKQKLAHEVVILVGLCLLNEVLRELQLYPLLQSCWDLIFRDEVFIRALLLLPRETALFLFRLLLLLRLLRSSFFALLLSRPRSLLLLLRCILFLLIYLVVRCSIFLLLVKSLEGDVQYTQKEELGVHTMHDLLLLVLRDLRKHGMYAE